MAVTVITAIMIMPNMASMTMASMANMTMENMASTVIMGRDTARMAITATPTASMVGVGRVARPRRGRAAALADRWVRRRARKG